MKANSGRILAIDLGLKRTGLAVSDERWITTRALKTLTPKSRQEDIDHILKICRELEVKCVLIGYPKLPQTGDESFMSKRALGFYETLQKQLPSEIKINLIDESYTSKQAARRLGNTRAFSKKLDGESARILIEDFIEDFHDEKNS